MPQRSIFCKIYQSYKKSAILVTILMCLSSCREPHLYDDIGFDPTLGNRPENFEDPNSSTRRVAPDYYYRQPAYQQQPNYRQAAQPIYRGQPTYAAPPRGGGSRFYSNPYAIPPSTQYPHYDADQYYVPPTYYNNIEPQMQLEMELFPESYE